MSNGIGKSELLIQGKWIRVGSKVDGDEACQRIDTLVETHLAKVGVASCGWDTLYRDPEDGRYWELVYLNGDWHGGGPPTLRCLSEDEARQKYKL
jgi:hypothetical protein